jgi:hypothetical protein
MIPQYHESMPISPDDAIIREGFNQMTPEERRAYNQRVAWIKTFAVLERRRQLLAVKMAYDLLRTGEIKTHSGKISMGLPAPTVLTGTNDDWSDTTNSDPIAYIVDQWENFENVTIKNAKGQPANNIKPDFVILDRKAKNLFMNHPKVGQADFKNFTPDRLFSRAFGQEKASKEWSKDILYLGKIEEIGLDLYYSIGSIVNFDGTEVKLLDDNTMMFGIRHSTHPNVAGWIHGAIPKVSVNKNNTNVDARWESLKIRSYSTVNDAQTMAEIYLMSSFAPYIAHPNVFKRYVVA